MYTSTEDTSTPAWVASASAMAVRSWAASSGSTSLSGRPMAASSSAHFRSA